MRVLRLLQRRLFPSGEKKGLQIVKVNNNAEHRQEGLMFDLDLKEDCKKIRQDTYQASLEQRRDCSNNISGPKYCDGIYYPR